MIIGAAQWNVRKKDKDYNLGKVAELIGDSKVDLVVLTELFATGYFFEEQEDIHAVAEAVPGGYTTQALCKIAAEKNCHLAGAIVEQEGDCFYISAVVVGPKGYVGKQRKRHLTSGETRFYTPGDSSAVFDINGCKVGVIICYEGWFPESVRELTLLGAQIVCHSVLTMSTTTLDIVRVRAIENKSFVIFANSISADVYQGQPIQFRGNSRIIDHNGNILADAGQEERLVFTEVDETLTAIKALEDCEDLIFEINKHWESRGGQEF